MEENNKMGVLQFSETMEEKNAYECLWDTEMNLTEKCKKNSGIQLVDTGVTKVKIEPLIDPLIYATSNSFTNPNPLQFAKTMKQENEEKEMRKLKNRIKKVIYVDKDIKVKEPVLDSDGNQIEKDGKPVTKDKLYKGMVKVLWTDGKETISYTSIHDTFNKETGFKTCVMKYMFGNRDSYDAVDFWTNRYVKYPSSCVEVSEALWKLGEILEKDKNRPEKQKGLHKAKFLRYKCTRLFDKNAVNFLFKKELNEFKKLARKYFPELRCREIYINDSKQNEIFVAIK